MPPYLSYLNTNQFQSAQALQVVARFDAASTNGAAVVLWFSLADLQGEVDAFSHLGLLEPGSGTNMTKKPAYDAFKNYTATNRF